MRASSEWDQYHAAYLARLNLKPRGRFKGGWSAKKNNRKQWIQVNFRRPVRVSMVAMQGREDANQFVTSFAVAYSPDGYRWTPFKANSRLKVLLFWYLNRCCTWNCFNNNYTTKMRNFCNLIGLEQWYFSLIWNTYMWKLQNYCG